MLRTAFLQASVRFSSSFSPAAVMGMPMTPSRRLGTAISGSAK